MAGRRGTGWVYSPYDLALHSGLGAQPTSPRAPVRPHSTWTPVSGAVLGLWGPSACPEREWKSLSMHAPQGRPFTLGEVSPAP